MILVIGARSRTGQELVRLLRADNVPLRILTRSSEPAGDPDTVVGDLAEPATLDAAMSGVDKVFLLSTPAPDERAWHRNAVEAAKRAGVRQLVRNSILGADPKSPARFARHHGLADSDLRDSGVPFTILRPNMYMHNVSLFWPPTIDPLGNYYAPAGDARISMVDVRDVAAVAFTALTEPGHLGATYDLTGPEALSHAEAADRLGAVLGREVRYVPVDDESARSAMLGAGLNEWFAGGLIELYQNYRRSGANGYASALHLTPYEAAGVKPRTLDQLLADDLGAS